MGIHTERGRVVYNRKKHEWKLKDLNRIGRKLEVSALRVVQIWVDRRGWKDLLAYLWQQAADRNFEGFYGGSFGGAGATRTFGEYAEWVEKDDAEEAACLILWKLRREE